MAEKKSFWSTLPGILSGIATVITAFGGLLVILYQIDMIHSSGGDDPQKDPQARIEETIHELEQTHEELLGEIEALRHEAEHNPQVMEAIREREESLHEVEIRMDELHGRLAAMEHR
jgi:hypothetical protein